VTSRRPTEAGHYVLPTGQRCCTAGGMAVEQPQKPEIIRPPDPIDKPPPDIKPVPPPDIPPPAGPPDVQPTPVPERGGMPL
jgi:hypothetical protein